MTSTAIVAYLALFVTVGVLFVFASLLLGRFLRSSAPSRQKLETYECGEPAIGPGAVQFDLRFYVVALVFLIFEVEVAFFFPPATVFGKACQLLRSEPTAATTETYRELGVPTASAPSPSAPDAPRAVAAQANTLALAAMCDLGVFFAVLLVGFAYVWRRGDLDWVRAVGHPAAGAEASAAPLRLRGEERR